MRCLPAASVVPCTALLPRSPAAPRCTLAAHSQRCRSRLCAAPCINTLCTSHNHVSATMLQQVQIGRLHPALGVEALPPPGRWVRCAAADRLGWRWRPCTTSPQTDRACRVRTEQCPRSSARPPPPRRGLPARQRPAPSGNNPGLHPSQGCAACWRPPSSRRCQVRRRGRGAGAAAARPNTNTRCRVTLPVVSYSACCPDTVQMRGPKSAPTQPRYAARQRSSSSGPPAWHLPTWPMRRQPPPLRPPHPSSRRHSRRHNRSRGRSG